MVEIFASALQKDCATKYKADIIAQTVSVLQSLLAVIRFLNQCAWSVKSMCRKLSAYKIKE